MISLNKIFLLFLGAWLACTNSSQGMEQEEQARQAKQPDRKKRRIEELTTTPPPSPKQEPETQENKIKITFYNVGQGNCVLLENPQMSQAVLVDCGSREHDKMIRDENQKPIIKLNKVVKNIKNKMDSYKKRFILITHMDSDHYNLIPIIFPSEEMANEKERELKVIIADKSVQQKKDSLKFNTRDRPFNTWLNNYHNENKLDIISKPEQLVKTLEVLGLIAWIEPISVIASDGTENKKTNADSIVIKVRAGQGKCSALLPGDANQTTTKFIKESFKDQEEKLKTTLLLSSHHGADSEGQQ
jgi:beta-lactamase superfamily II metal-dependent hydrolase